MGSSPTPPKGKTRLRLIAIVTACVVVLVVIAVATRGFGLAKSNEATSAQQTAQDRCEFEVRKQSASPSTAELANVETTQSPLDPDSKDLFRLMLDDELKGVDHSRITVWEVSGVVSVRNDLGAVLHDRFSCRAYFVDANLADTLVLFNHAH